MRKLLLVGVALLAGALTLSVDGAFAAQGAGGGGTGGGGGGGTGGGGGGGGQKQAAIVFGFPTTDALNAALAANPGLVGVAPAPDSLLMPVQYIVFVPKI
jgi:hypothetical protein